MNKDLISSGALLGIAGAYYWLSTEIPVSTLEDAIGPRGLPNVLTVLLVVFALAIGVRALAFAPRAKRAPAEDDEEEAPWPRAAGMLALGPIYIVLAMTLGYPIALFLLLIAVMLYEGMKPRWQMFAVAIGGALVFWFLFAYVLGVRQPEGLLF